MKAILLLAGILLTVRVVSADASSNAAPSPTPATTGNPKEQTVPTSSSASSSAPQSASEFNSQGFEKYKGGDLDGAIADFSQAIALDPKLAEAYNRRGNAKKGKGDLAGAVADYRQAITVDPKYANPYSNLGIIALTTGDVDGAIADFSQAILLDPKLAQAYGNRSIAKRQKGDVAGANADFNQAIALDPKLARTYDRQEEVSLSNLIRNGDPNINKLIGSFKVEGDVLVVTTTDSFNASPYQDRLQFAQSLFAIWAKFHGTDSPSNAPSLSMIDTTGTEIGGTNSSGVWVLSQAPTSQQEAITTPPPSPASMPFVEKEDINADWKTTDGTVYHVARIWNIEPDSVTVIDQYGTESTIDIAMLPTDLQKRFNYDPAAASAIKQQRAQQEQLQEQSQQQQAQLQRMVRKAVALRGVVLQKINGGLLIHQGYIYPITKGANPYEDYSQRFEIVFLKDYAKEDSVVDGSGVAAVVYPTGPVSYTSVLGSDKTVASFDALPEGLIPLPPPPSFLLAPSSPQATSNTGSGHHSMDDLANGMQKGL